MNTPTHKTQKLAFVQYLRAIAVIAVVVDHAAGMAAFNKYFGIKVFNGFLYHGSIGVDLFFVISGFIITLVALDKDLQPKLSAKLFLLKRAARIIPLMWISIISYAVLRSFSNGYFPFYEYVTAFFLLPYGDVDPNNIWTLRHEYLFYIFFALSMIVRKMTSWILIIWFSLPVAYTIILGEIDIPFLRVIASPVNIEFCFGFIIGILYIKGKITETNFKYFPIITISICYFILVMYLVHNYHLEKKLLINKLIIRLLVSVLLIIALKVSQTGLAISKIFFFLGEASFSIYLFHLHFESASLGLLKRINPTLDIFIVIIITSLVSTFACIIIYLTLEKYLVRTCTYYIEKLA